jgi:hypothetical protein
MNIYSSIKSILPLESIFEQQFLPKGKKFRLGYQSIVILIFFQHEVVQLLCRDLFVLVQVVQSIVDESSHFLELQGAAVVDVIGLEDVGDCLLEIFVLLWLHFLNNCSYL